MQVIAKFMALMYSYLNISLSQNIVPEGIKGREIHHSFPVSLFMVILITLLSLMSSYMLQGMINRKKIVEIKTCL
jgi:hypothetical protein